MLSRDEKLVLGGPAVKKYTHYCNACQETYPMIEVDVETEEY